MPEFFNCDNCESYTNQSQYMMYPLYEDRRCCSDCYWKCGIKEILIEERKKLSF